MWTELAAYRDAPTALLHDADAPRREGGPREAVAAWTAPSTQRVMPSAQPPPTAALSACGGGGELSQTISLARAETESFQLVLRSPREIPQVDLEFDGLPAGVSLRHWQVGHVWVDAIKPNTDGGRGWWPDALLDREKPHLSAAVAQPLWIDVVATPSAAAGLHTSARVVVTWPSTGDGD